MKPVGDSAVRIELGQETSPLVHRRVRAYAARVEAAAIPGVVEWVPSYAALTVYYLPHLVQFRDLCRALEGTVPSDQDVPLPPGDLVTLPVLYGGEGGPDLEFVASHHHLSVQEVVELHSRPEYLVYMIGFAPGFPYLGGLSEQLATPRLEKPRLSVPRGSVGIGGSQTGVYSVDSPGGWRLIGRTPVPLYEPHKETPTLLEAGNLVRFRPVDRNEYSDIESAVQRGSYIVERRPSSER